MQPYQNDESIKYTTYAETLLQDCLDEMHKLGIRRKYDFDRGAVLFFFNGRPLEIFLSQESMDDAMDGDDYTKFDLFEERFKNILSTLKTES